MLANQRYDTSSCTGAKSADKPGHAPPPLSRLLHARGLNLPAEEQHGAGEPPRELAGAHQEEEKQRYESMC